MMVSAPALYGSSSEAALLLAELEESTADNKLFPGNWCRGGVVAFDVFGGIAFIGHQHAEVLVAVLAEGMSADNKPLDSCYKCQRRKGDGLMIRWVRWVRRLMATSVAVARSINAIR